MHRFFCILLAIPLTNNKKRGLHTHIYTHNSRKMAKKRSMGIVHNAQFISETYAGNVR